MLGRALALGCALLTAAPAGAGITIVKTGPAGPLEAGQGFSYSITVTNTGTTPLTFDLNDTLPAEVVFYSLWVDGAPSEGQVDCHLPSYETNDAPIDCVYTNLAPQASAQFEVYVALRYCLPSGINVSNTATASGGSGSSDSSSWSFFTLAQTDPYCSDYNGCTEYDVCYEGYCEGQPINGCPDGSVCTIDGCDPVVGCTFEPITCPDDTNPCTVADCHPIDGCFQANSPAGTACPLTGPCIAGGVCDGTGTCAPVTVCDDGNVCTNDFADASCACSYTFVSTGAGCDDGDSCTIQDACNGGGVCAGAPYPAPAEVDNSVRLNSYGGPQQPGQTWITWGAASYAETYDAIRGLLAALPVGPGSGDEICVGYGLPASSYPDYQNPLPGTGYWYLLRGVNACAGRGPWGFQGNHGAPGAPRVTTTSCP